MSSSSDKAKGIGNQIIGRAKQAAGDVTGDEALRLKGLAQEAKGVGQEAAGDIKSAIKKVVDES